MIELSHVSKQFGDETAEILPGTIPQSKTIVKESTKIPQER